MRRLVWQVVCSLVVVLGLSLSACSGTQAPTQVTIDVKISGGQVEPNGTTVDVAKGGTVTLKGVSDVADEVHVHGYDKTLNLKPGVAGEVSFTADQPGVFEIESHESGKVIVKLAVR